MGKWFSVNFGGKTDWSKGIIKLFETVEYVVGPAVEPLKKLLMAKAEKFASIEAAKGNAEVARIKAESKVEIDQIKARSKAELAILQIETSSMDDKAELAIMELEATAPVGKAINPAATAEIEALIQRTKNRIGMDAIRQQNNIESIVEKAADEMPGNVSETPVDKDWTADFFDSVKNVSEDEMQSLWARILVGEVAQPGSFTKRTLSLVKTLTKQEAGLFAKLCVFNWNAGQMVYVWDAQDKFFTDRGINYGILMELETTGLIQFNKVGAFSVKFPGPVLLNYFGRLFSLQRKGNVDKFDLGVGPVVFSRPGQELLRIVKPEPDNEYLRLALANIEKNGFSIQEGLSPFVAGQFNI